jgi:hypothetical protein
MNKFLKIDEYLIYFKFGVSFAEHFELRLSDFLKI